jgi:hypothetical protein
LPSQEVIEKDDSREVDHGEPSSTTPAPQDFRFGNRPKLHAIANRAACFLPLPICKRPNLILVGPAIICPSLGLRRFQLRLRLLRSNGPLFEFQHGSSSLSLRGGARPSQHRFLESITNIPNKDVSREPILANAAAHHNLIFSSRLPLRPFRFLGDSLGLAADPMFFVLC